MPKFNTDQIEALKRKIFDSDEEVMVRFQGNGLTIEQIVLFQKIATECTPEEFYNLLYNGQIPSLRLTTSEMDLLKGGKWINDAIQATKKFLLKQ